MSLDRQAEKLGTHLEEKLKMKKQEMADQLMQNIDLVIDGYLGGKQSTMGKDSFKYKITEEGIDIWTDDKRVVFFEKGTKPHKIRPKNGKALAFTANQSFTYKDGSAGQFGDRVVVKEVNHPGTKPRPILGPALHGLKNKFS